MALEVQILVDKAKAAIASLEERLRSLRGTVDQVGQSSGPEKLASDIQNIKPVPPQVEKSMTAVQSAMNAMAAARTGAVSAVSSVGSALNTAAASAMTMGRSLGTIAWNTAAAGARGFVNVLAGLVTAGGGVINMLGGVRGALALLGFGAAIKVARDFIKESYEMVSIIERFNAVMSNTRGPDQAAKALQFLRTLSFETSNDFHMLSEQFIQFSNATDSAGVAADTAAAAFRDIAIGIRGSGVSAEQAKGIYKAFNDMLNKGKVQSEELVKQLGNRGIPAFSLMAKAIGVTTQQLSDMLKKGALGIPEIIKLAGALRESFEGSLDAMNNSLEGVTTNLKNVWGQVAGAFGGTFWEPIKAGLKVLTELMKDPAFMTFAKTLGIIAGLVAGAFLVAVIAAVGAIDLLVKTFTGIVDIGTFIATSVFLLFSTGLQAISDAVVAVGNFLYKWLIEPLSFLAPIFGPVITAISEFVKWLFSGQTALSATSEQLGWLGPVIQTVAAGWDAFVAVLQTGYNIITTVTSGIATFWDWLVKLASAANILSPSFDKATSASYQLSGASAESAGTAAEQAKNLQSAADSGWEQEKAARAAASATKAANAEAANGSGFWTSLASSIYSAAKALWDWVTAKEAANAAGGGSPSGGGGDTSESFRGGGIVGQASRVAKGFTAADFIGAPQFAGGTANTSSYGASQSGMPAILHPNEAVIPLTGGGSVPVSLSASGGGNSTGGRNYPDLIWRALEDSNAFLATIDDSVKSVGVIVKDEMDRSFAVLNDVNNNQKDLIIAFNKSADQIKTAISQMQSSSSSSSSGGSSSSSSASGQYQEWKSAGGGQFFIGKDGNVYAKPNMGFGGNTGSPGKAMYFAEGSPNAEKDASGGFQATLHPDEAVIPLPDGRSVPVDISNWKDLKSKREVQQDITVNFTINTPDADSFKRSKDQIMQELAANLKKAAGTLGTQSKTDDPTRRQ